jgi:hypothetical protein
MRRSRCWDVLVGMIAIAAAGLATWTVTPGDQERRFRQIRAGMFEGEVRSIMGSSGDPAAKKYRITGDNRQRVWTVCEKGQRMQIVIVFDSTSRVVDKEIWKSLPILDSFGE